MSKSTTADLSKESRKAKMDVLVSFLTRGQPMPPYTEEFESDMSFSQTKANWDAANSAVDPEEPITRQPAIYAGALLRDAKYAHAGRNFLLKQAHHNAFRELYEGGKIGLDNERQWASDE